MPKSDFTEEVKELVEPVGPHSKKAGQMKVSVKATVFFVDGTLREAFQKLGYNVEWPKNEVREIPTWLLNRCKQSGGEFETVDG